MRPSMQTHYENTPPRSQVAVLSGISDVRRRGYCLLSLYIRYCLDKGLIKVWMRGGPEEGIPSKSYTLADRGARLLTTFTHIHVP